MFACPGTNPGVAMAARNMTYRFGSGFIRVLPRLRPCCIFPCSAILRASRILWKVSHVAEPRDFNTFFPVYNEIANLERLHAEVVEAMEGLGRSFEIVAVDDGSTDGSFGALRLLRERDPRLRVIRLARNFGQNPALYAGFAQVRGRIIVTIDSDLQNPRRTSRSSSASWKRGTTTLSRAGGSNVRTMYSERRLRAG
jgi:hypothetical protein